MLCGDDAGGVAGEWKAVEGELLAKCPRHQQAPAVHHLRPGYGMYKSSCGCSPGAPMPCSTSTFRANMGRSLSSLRARSNASRACVGLLPYAYRMARLLHMLTLSGSHCKPSMKDWRDCSNCCSRIWATPMAFQA